MEVRVLRYFLTAAREENITKAAALLHVSQPTLSRQMKELEEELGKKLFVRSNYSIKLTEEGALLRVRAADIVDMVDKTEAEFKSMEAAHGGDIRVGCAESDGIRHFARAVKRLREKYPRIRFHIYSGGTEAVCERLDKGLLDFAVIVQEANVSKYNVLKVPSSDRWGVLMPENSPLACKSAITPENLSGLPLICSRQGMEDELRKWFGDSLERMNVAVTYDLFFNASVMVREGLGYAVGFRGIVAEGNGLCFRPLHPPLESPMYIIWRRHQSFTKAAAMLLAELQMVLES